MAGESGDQPVLVEVDRAGVVQHLQHQAVPRQQPRECDDESGYPDPGEEEPVYGTGERARHQGEQERQPLRHPVVDREYGEHGAGQTADRAHRQVDLTQQQNEDDTDGYQPGADDVDREVAEVLRGEEVAVQRLEDRPDDDQPDDDRYRAELSGTHLADELGEITAESLLPYEEPGVDGRDGTGSGS